MAVLVVFKLWLQGCLLLLLEVGNSILLGVGEFAQVPPILSGSCTNEFHLHVTCVNGKVHGRCSIGTLKIPCMESWR